MSVSAQDLCRMAGEMAFEHGVLAVDVARRAYREMDAEGDETRAQFWFLMSVLIDDILRYGIDSDDGPVIN